ncbi:glycosyltransferase family 4 protein (plasmid) [Salipiger sp. H15]|uniref:Glycosyltransferase family 4 protein n=1 Tax=Alloyangia sp. H15 TaxID=3029062 RepID=A0AAU8AR32_9RHOB
MKIVLLASEPVDYAIAYANGVGEHAEVTMFVPQRLYADLAQWISPGIDLRLIDWPRTRSLRNPKFVVSLAMRIRRERPDAVHLLSNTTLWLNALAPLLKGIPLVVTVHDVDVHPGDRDTLRLPVWASRMMARQAGAVVVHGRSLRAAAAARLGLPDARLHVLPHPSILRYADLARELGLTRAEEPPGFRVLCFGRLYAYKGLADLVRAEALLAGALPGLAITIAGRGDDPAELEPLMGDPAAYDIRHRFIPDAEVAELFTDADLVVLPYTEASQSGVLHVAAAFGRPVVATDVGELRSTVEANGLGVIVPPSDPARLAGAILELAEDPARLAALGARSLRWAERTIAPDAVGAMATSLYGSITRVEPSLAESTHR